MSENKTWYEKLRQSLMADDATFKQVELLSYHLPKTAGTSLYLALEQAFGTRHIDRVYDHGDIARLLDGKARFVKPAVQVMHGHFRPHPSHASIYPNAKRIIWVRDPINWCWSTLQHYLWQKNGKVYQHIQTNYLANKDWDTNELFLALLQDEYFDRVRLYFSKFNKHVESGFFDFVGKSEDFESELKRLGNVIGRELPIKDANRNPNNQSLHLDRKEIYPYFESQYQFIEAFFGISYQA